MYTVSGPLLFGLLVTLVTLIGFAGLWRIARSLDPVEARAKEYGGDRGFDGDLEDEARSTHRAARSKGFLAKGFGLGPRLATSLARADVALTVNEFTGVILGAGALGFAIGVWRLGAIPGLVSGALFACAPFFYLRVSQGRRQRAFSGQLPDVLTMLVGALRAGYGLTQAVQALVERFPQPASREFDRVMRAVGLGVGIQRALRDMTERVGGEELELVVTAINVQHETGGNLAETLETIGETIRDRIRIQREIGVFTAQQQMTGYVLAGLPVGLAVLIFMMSPDFFKPFFEPGWARLLPIGAVVMQVVGFVVMRRVLAIEV